MVREDVAEIKKKWMLRNAKVDIKKIAAEAGVYGLTAKVLVNRGMDSVESIKGFFDNSIENLYDSEKMKDMRKGVDIIKKSIHEGRKIVVYGDYDADGVTSTAILYKSLKACGAHVGFHIPDREHEGYGMNTERISILKEEGYEVIITCDNGISAVEEIRHAKELGFQVVITDHHELPFKEVDGKREFIMPEADAVINPKRFDCEYRFKSLCGAGISFKFALLLLEDFGVKGDIRDELIQFAGIGTICDVVDLIEENRVIAINGLKELCRTRNLGLASLIDVLGVDKDKVKSYTIGFQIGPCINATGRLEKADLSFELLVTEDPKRAKELAKSLFEINKKRQDMTNENVETIIEELKKGIKDKVLVIFRPNIHESIAGIVAGRVKETFNLPTFVLTEGKEMPKGSGRSIEGYNMFEEMIKCKDVLYKFGGHPMAAGLSIKEENIDPFREKLNELCELTDDDLIPKLKIDNRLPLDYITRDIVDEIAKLEPFGKGNSKPIFAEKNIEIKEVKMLGQDGNTLKLLCKTPNGRFIDAIGFNKTADFVEVLKDSFGVCWREVVDKPRGLKVDMAFYPSINSFRGKESLNLKIEDIRISDI